MTTPETTRRPGRPATGKAMSPAQRMRLARERARVAVLDEDLEDLTRLSDTGLFEVLRVVHQRRMPFEVAKIARELLRRATEGTTYTATVTVIDTATVAEPDNATVTDTATATVAAIDSVTVTKTDTATVAKDYPPEVKAEAVRMHQAGRSRDEIRAWLITRVGKAPDAGNWSKALRRWQEALQRHGQE